MPDVFEFGKVASRLCRRRNVCRLGRSFYCYSGATSETVPVTSRPVRNSCGVAFRIIWRSVKAPQTNQTRPNEFNNKQNQTLTLKAERLSLLAKARLSFPSFILLESDGPRRRGTTTKLFD